VDVDVDGRVLIIFVNIETIPRRTPAPTYRSVET